MAEGFSTIKRPNYSSVAAYTLEPGVRTTPSQGGEGSHDVTFRFNWIKPTTVEQISDYGFSGHGWFTLNEGSPFDVYNVYDSETEVNSAFVNGKIDNLDAVFTKWYNYLNQYDKDNMIFSRFYILVYDCVTRVF